MSIIGGNKFIWQGDLTFTFTVSDAEGNTSDGTVTIPAPDAAPIAANDLATVVAGSSVVIDVLANDSDPEGAALTVATASAVTGSVVINADGTLGYTAPAGGAGSDTVTYTISDPAGNTDEGRVDVSVTAAPTLSIDTLTSIGDFSIAANAGEIVLTVLEPADYADVYTIVTDDLQTGPLNLVPPVISGSFAAGQTLVASPGLWAGREVDGAIAFAYQWVSGSAEIPGATSDRYTVQSADVAAGLSLTVRATNAVADRTERVDLVSTAWMPANDPSVVGWYDFSDAASLTLDGNSLIEAAADKSGTGATARQSSASARGALATINGLQAADFSAGAGLQIAEGWQPAAQDSIMLAVVGDTTSRGPLIISRSGTDIRFAIRWGGGTRNTQYIHSNAREGNWQGGPASGSAIAGGYRSGSSSYSGFNGAYGSAYSVGTAPTLDNWNIGSLDGAGENAFAQPIGEIVVALDPTDVVATRQKIEGYLAHKWDLVSALDADHPYKSAPPSF